MDIDEVRQWLIYTQDLTPRITLRLVTLLPLLVAVLGGWALATSQRVDTGLRYLVVWRGGRPEKNYYELTMRAEFMERRLYDEELLRRYVEFVRHEEMLGHHNFGPGPDIITDHTARYGVYKTWKVRIIGTSDSQKAPTSAKDGTFVLTYSRNPDWNFAAKKYKVVRRANGGQSVTYTDFQDGREYTMELSPDWPRSWMIYEVEILSSNAFIEIWQTSERPKINP